MAGKSLFRTAILAAMLLTAAACIYPYEVDISQEGEYPLVIEGDIHLGGTTTLTLSHVWPFNTEGYEFPYIRAQGYIEGEDGTRVSGTPDLENALTSSWLYRGRYVLAFDTSKLPDQRYRLHFETLSELGEVINIYESDWLEPCPAPTIDGLTYSKHDDFKEMWVGLSMHCNGSHYFRWTFSETWEYHSDIYSSLKYNPETRLITQYDGPNLYFCWRSQDSPQINIFSTAYQTEDRFEDLSFHTIPLSDKRLQVMYRITVRLEALSENAYNYWYNIQQNTNGQGSIFAPTPSEMASNVHCISNPAIQVMGYLNAARQAEAMMYYDNSENHFYEPGRPFERADTMVVNSPAASEEFYRRGFLPFEEVYESLSDTPSHYMWTPSICIDCQKQGGTKKVPEGWPSGHK
jgi:hypothetical protein